MTSIVGNHYARTGNPVTTPAGVVVLLPQPPAKGGSTSSTSSSASLTLRSQT